jgi:hypothetical protein
MPHSHDPDALRIAWEQEQGQSAARQQQQLDEQRKRLAREDAARAFCNAKNERMHAAPFWQVCDVIREQGFADVLARLDLDKLAEHHHGDYSAELSTRACREVAALLLECSAAGLQKANVPKQRLRATFTIPAARHLARALVTELLIRPPDRFITPIELDHHRRRYRHYERDHLWLDWANQGMTPAQIRDRWNREYRQYGGRPIGEKRRGYDVVKKALKKAQEERIP